MPSWAATAPDLVTNEALFWLDASALDAAAGTELDSWADARGGSYPTVTTYTSVKPQVIEIAAALFAANEAARAAMESRSDERSSRAEEKAAGTTPELRKAVAALLVAAARRVNAVNEIAPTEAASAAITKVAALVEEYKLVASQFKGKKKADPEPEPEPTPEPEASVS